MRRNQWVKNRPDSIDEDQIKITHMNDLPIDFNSEFAVNYPKEYHIDKEIIIPSFEFTQSRSKSVVSDRIHEMAEELFEEIIKRRAKRRSLIILKEVNVSMTRNLSVDGFQLSAGFVFVWSKGLDRAIMERASFHVEKYIKISIVECVQKASVNSRREFFSKI